VGWRLCHLGRRRATTAEQAQNGQRADAEHPAAQKRDHDGANANIAPAQQATDESTAPAASTTSVAAIFDVIRLAVAFPFHSRCSW